MKRVVGTIAPARDLGALLFADEIAERYFRGRASARWVASQMPRDRAVPVGRRLAWYEADIEEAIAATRGAA